MGGRVWILFIFMPSLVISTLINGFDLLDDFSEETSAGENVVFAETQFSPQLSVCQWVYPKRTIIGTGSVGFTLFELRSTCRRKIKDRPRSINYPSLYYYLTKTGWIKIQDQSTVKLGKSPSKNRSILHTQRAKRNLEISSRICPAPCVLCQCTIVFAWKCHLFCLC